ncbi:MAG TPA: hypothetical protein VN718_02775 [Rhizomicrobium sp.]|nr:hypothetical protein [Rhizomicrobium sp.]
MRLGWLALVSLLSAASGAVAQTEDFRGTVDEVTPAQLEHGRAAVTKAGYRPVTLQFGQDGNLFFTAARNGMSYDVTLTRGGRVYAGSGLPENTASGASD